MSAAVAISCPRDATERVARESQRKLVALLASHTRDPSGAEDALADAFVAALVEWPSRGVPANPEAWLVTVARRKWIDGERRRRTAEDGAEHVRRIAEEREAAAQAASDLPDERLALMFACAHPAIDAPVRAPLILQTVFGVDAAAIGAWLGVSPTAMRQRLVRAKHRIREAGIPFEIPERNEIAPRLGAVLEALHAVFELRRGGVDAADALRLCRVLVRLLPEQRAPRELWARMRAVRAVGRDRDLDYQRAS